MQHGRSRSMFSRVNCPRRSGSPIRGKQVRRLLAESGRIELGGLHAWFYY
jgi:hypothetical protein